MVAYRQGGTGYGHGARRCRVHSESQRARTSWKLQKLVYYCQAWSLVWDEEPLFEARIEAWANTAIHL